MSRIAVLGSGALGQFYGAQLLLAGHDVHFFARRDAPVLRSRGLVIHQAATSQVASTRTTPLLTRHPINVHEDTSTIGPVDWVVVALKTTGLDALAHLLPPVTGPSTRLTLLCNGLGVEERCAAWMPPERIFGQLCFVCVNRDDDGTIRHLAHGAVGVGSLARIPADDLADLWTSAGVRCPWKRHLTMAQMVQFCACAGQSLYLLANPGCCPRARACRAACCRSGSPARRRPSRRATRRGRYKPRQRTRRQSLRRCSRFCAALQTRACCARCAADGGMQCC
jgi:2-dehydropantoate 2-reductase